LPENGDIDEVANRANELLGDFLDTLRKRLDRERTLNDKVKVLQDAYGPDIDALKRREDDLFKQLVGLVTPRFSELVRKNTKTIYLRNGEIHVGLRVRTSSITPTATARRTSSSRSSVLEA
jgi:phage host-nuclease inhibitor protein Gam